MKNKQVKTIHLMKRILLLCCVFFGLFIGSFAHPVDLETARTIASKFMGTNDLQLSITYTTDKNTAAFYIFNTSNGFVIISADDCETPIIGYSHEGRFDPNDVPPQMEDFLQDFVARIQYGIENHIVADERTAKQWQLVKATGRLNDNKATKSIAPLLSEMWEQGCLYNSLCPSFEKVPCGHAETGCVAVAMGQIMHYWRYPTTGWGSHSYSNSGLTLSADFGNTVYDWDHMPDSLTDDSSEAEVEAVATLLFHCGVSVDMKYQTNGSGADSGDVPDALIRYFNYSRRLHIEKRSDFDDEEWMSMMKACLEQQRPIFYGGKSSQGSHAFVCDGYDDNDLLHFNWGWGHANGYFALGNLNPLGYAFNEKNFAILDINPEYEPWTVEATAYPPTAGHIEGTGEYHIGEQCTLTAIPNENCEFDYWKRNGKISSYNSSMTLYIQDDINDIEAHFSFQPIKDITANYAPDTNDINSPYVRLSWDHEGIREWNLLKELEIDGAHQGITTDGEYIYTSNYYNTTLELKKHTMDGELVDSFEIDQCNTYSIACDGNYLYCGNGHIYTLYLYCIDFNRHAIVDSINMNYRINKCAHDAINDSFWLLEYYPSKRISLVNRQGEIISNGPTISSVITIGGYGSIIAQDGNPHLLLLDDKVVIDYDVLNTNINHHRSFQLNQVGFFRGACIGKYEDKDAMFVLSERYTGGTNMIYVFEINNHLARILHYRLYRTDNQGNIVMLADEFTGTSFVDSTWANATAGEYRFGISEVYFNGVESEIIWSDPIVKTDIGIHENENDHLTDPFVQKVIEDGQIVIIKDGKRYNVSGQTLN